MAKTLQDILGPASAEVMAAYLVKERREAAEKAVNGYDLVGIAAEDIKAGDTLEIGPRGLIRKLRKPSSKCVKCEMEVVDWSKPTYCPVGGRCWDGETPLTVVFSRGYRSPEETKQVIELAKKYTKEAKAVETVAIPNSEPVYGISSLHATYDQWLACKFPKHAPQISASWGPTYSPEGQTEKTDLTPIVVSAATSTVQSEPDKPACPNHWTGGFSGICPDCGKR